MAAQYEYQFEEEFSPLHENLMEADPFFGRIRRAVSGLAKRAAPLLRRIAPIAARIAAGAIPGVGAIAGPLAGRLVGSLTQEQQQQLEAVLHEASVPHPEYNPEAWAGEAELQPEAWGEEEYNPEAWSGEEEFNPEAWSGEEEYNPEAWTGEEEFNPEAWSGEYQPSLEAVSHPEAEMGMTHSEALHNEAVLMEQIAHEAAITASEAEAEALIGSLVPLAARAFRSAAPSIRRAIPVLTRAAGRVAGALRRSPITRQLIRTMPTIVRGTVTTLARRVAQGAPVTPATALRTFAGQTYRVIGNPRVCMRCLRRNATLGRRPYMRQRAATHR